MEAPTFTAVWPGEFGVTFTLPVGADCLALAHGAARAMEGYFGRPVPLGAVAVSVVSAEHLAAISSDAGAAVARAPLPRVGAIPGLAITGGIVVEPRRESRSACRRDARLARIGLRRLTPLCTWISPRTPQPARRSPRTRS